MPNSAADDPREVTRRPLILDDEFQDSPPDGVTEDIERVHSQSISVVT